MKKRRGMLLVLLFLFLCGCQEKEVEQAAKPTASPAPTKSVEENVTPAPVTGLTVEPTVVQKSSWEAAYLEIMNNVTPYLYERNQDGSISQRKEDPRFASQAFLYARVHDFDKDGVYELLIGDYISSAVFTFQDGKAVKIADLVMSDHWSPSGVYLKNNTVVLEGAGSDGCGYTVFTYYEGEFYTGEFCEYHSKETALNGESVTYERFSEVMQMDVADYESRKPYCLEYIQAVKEDGIWYWLLENEKKPLDVSFDFSSIRADAFQVPLHTFSQEEIEIIPAVENYEYSEALQKGYVQQLRGGMPGTGAGIWYIIEVDGIEYYYAQYDVYNGKENETVRYGYSIISDAYSMKNGIRVGMLMKELLELYPAVAVMDVENNCSKNNVNIGMGWNGTAYPNSYMGTDSDWDYQGEDYRWENQFDEVLVADTDYFTEQGLPVYVAFLIKDEVIAAITFYCPTAG